MKISIKRKVANNNIKKELLEQDNNIANTKNLMGNIISYLE